VLERDRQPCRGERRHPHRERGQGEHQLINADLARMLSGQTADQAAPAARADGRRAFAILGEGIGDYARRAT
jgi:hypothetical protein